MSAADDDGDDTASETSSAAESQVPHASSSEGCMRSARSSAAQEGALPPPFPAGPTGAMSENGIDRQIAAELMYYEPQSRHSQSSMLRTALARAAAAAAGPLVALAAESAAATIAAAFLSTWLRYRSRHLSRIGALEMTEGSDAENSALSRAACWQDLAHLAGELRLIF